MRSTSNDQNTCLLTLQGRDITINIDVICNEVNTLQQTIIGSTTLIYAYKLGCAA